MILPTRDDFLANSLETVEHDDCSICKVPMTSPVRTPCKHDFCKHCITEWLMQPEVDTCPVCRRSLFQKVPAILNVDDFLAEAAAERKARHQANMRAIEAEYNEATRARTLRYVGRVAEIASRRSLAPLPHAISVTRAFGAAGLTQGIPRVAQTDFRSADVLTLNDSVRWSESRLTQLTHHARWMLDSNELPRLPQGAVQIEAESLGTSLIIMSNALMHLAIQQSRPWSVANRDTWRQMVMNIWQLVAPEYGLLGVLLNRESLFLAIMSSVIEQQCTSGDEQVDTYPKFFLQAVLVRDLRFMINFVVDHAGPTMSSETVQEELAAHRIEEPQVYTSNVSERAERLAAAYTSMTFVHA